MVSEGTENLLALGLVCLNSQFDPWLLRCNKMLTKCTLNRNWETSWSNGPQSILAPKVEHFGKGTGKF